MRHAHRLLLLAATGASIAAVWALVRRLIGGGEVETVFLQTGDRGALFVAFIACAMVFPLIAGVTLSSVAWSRDRGSAGTFTRSFCLVSAALQVGLIAAGRESPPSILILGAALFLGSAVTAPPAPHSENLPVAIPDTLHQRLGWALLVSSLVLLGWTFVALTRIDLSSVWGKGSHDFDLFMGALIFPPMIAIGMLTARRGTSPMLRAQARMAIRGFCIVAAIAMVRLAFKGAWGLPVWPFATMAAPFFVAAALPWRDPAS